MQLLNIILKSVLFPNRSTECMIKSIFQPGDVRDHIYYRVITISSCLSKLYLKMLLDQSITVNHVLCRCLNKTGFRKQTD